MSAEIAGRYTGTVLAHIFVAHVILWGAVLFACFVDWSLDPFRQMDVWWWVRVATAIGLVRGLWEAFKEDTP